MKGIVFNLLEGFVADTWGAEKYEEILALCPLMTKQPFVGPGTYPDADLITIATKAAEILDLPLPDALRAFGRYCLPHLMGRMPQLRSQYTNPKSLLLAVEEVVHVEVRKLMPAAVTPTFVYDSLLSDRIVLYYQSERKLCFFMEGLLEGLALEYQTDLDCRQSRCMHAGAPNCRFEIEFPARSPRVN